MPKRFANPRLVKIHRSYTVEEAAQTLSHHENTVRTWIKEGLPVCNEQRPFLILGQTLRDFLEARRAKNKRPCKSGELYCLRCRSPRMPAEGMADCFRVSDTVGHLQALCPDCLCIMNRRVSLTKMDQIQAILTVTFRQAQGRVSNTNKPTLNSDFEGGV
jgi:hypothetical protein